MTKAVQGGMVEFCERLSIRPSVLFGNTRTQKDRFIKGLYYHLMYRAGYQYKQIAEIVGVSSVSVSKNANNALRSLQRRKNPHQTMMYDKVKDIKVLFSEDLTKYKQTHQV